MNEIVIERLAQRLLKCPFDQELFDSALSLRLHLCDAHRTQMARPHRVACLAAPENIERPKRLYCCPHCVFVVPDPFCRNPNSEICNHIRVEHPSPNPCEPTGTGFKSADDEELIDRYMEQQGTIEVLACARESCNTICDDDDSVALHWAEEHCDHPSAEEVRCALEVDPERFRIPLAGVFREVQEEETRQQLAYREPEDGYLIHHSPNVPRVRSRPAESIVYLEHELRHSRDRELEELLEREGWDEEAEDSPGEEWSEGRQQATMVELRFCNKVDGYIPLVKDVRQLLPPLRDGETVEVSWEAEQDSWFPCKVSRSKRAIYNLECQLRDIFWRFPSGVRLYITRVGPRRYRLGVRRQPHIVPNCKVFNSDGRGGWTVEIRDEMVEWETGDHVFRHQLNFQQMEALRDEARRAGVSIRDAVNEAMRRYAQQRPIHVITVHDIVFPRRTCSLAAVWAQFRPEHTCYVRGQPGWYRFDPAGHFPAVRIDQPPTQERDVLRPYPRHGRTYRVKRRGWSFNIFRNRLDDFRSDGDACLEVRCAFGTVDEVVFLIPIRYLEEHVLPRAHVYEGGRYTFNVHEQDLSFIWQHGIRMEGKPFLDRSGSSSPEDDRLTYPV